MDLRLIATKKARKKIDEYIKKYGTEVSLTSATRDSASLSVRDELWIYEEEHGRFVAKLSDHGAPPGLRAYAFFRAAEAVMAVRKGHKEHVARAQDAAARDPIKAAKKRKKIRARELSKAQLTLHL